jgi:O-antigen ligase
VVSFASRADHLVPRRAISATFVASVYCVLLVVVPSRLIVRQIGAAGTPATLWGLGALLWWTCMTVGGLNPARRANPVRCALGALGVVVGASYVSAMVSGWYVPADVREATSDIFDLVPNTLEFVTSTSVDAADRGLMAFGAWVGIALVVIDGVRTWRDLDTVLTWLVRAATAMAVIGLVQYFFGWNISSLFRVPGLVANDEFGAIDQRSVVRRVYATAVHPIEFGVVLAAIFPLAMHRALVSSRRIHLIPPIAIGFAIPIAVSRSAVLVLAVALVVLFVGWPPRWRVSALLVAPIAIATIRVLMPGVVGTTIAFFTHFNDDPSISGRTNDYAVVMSVASDHVWFGRGLFTFIPRFYRILDNQYLRLLLEVGVIGLVVVVVLLFVAFGSARGAIRRSSDRAARHQALALSASVMGLTLSYATFDAWSAPIAAGLTFVVVGSCGAAWNLARSGTEPPGPLPSGSGDRIAPRPRDAAAMVGGDA